MNMTDVAKKMLLDLAKHPRAKEGAELRYSSDSTEKRAEISAVDELVNLGYVIKTGSAIGFSIFVITSAGEAAAIEI